MNRVSLLFGAAFGFLVAASGMHDYDVIHRMLSLREPDLFLLMASAIAVSLPLLWVLERRRWQTRYGGPLTLARYRVQRKDLLGGAVFGAGWAIAGTCPVPALAMVVGGGVLGVCVIAGLFTGLLLRDAYVARQTTGPSVPPAAATAEPAR